MSFINALNNGRGMLLPKFTETINEETTEVITLVEKITKIDGLIGVNYSEISSNADAISTNDVKMD